MTTPTGIAVATRQAASGYALRASPRRKTYTTSWDINEKQLRQRLEDVRFGLVKMRWIRGKPAPTT